MNPLKDWIDSDPQLSTLLVEIQSKDLSLNEQAEEAFHQLAEKFNIPKLPEDVDSLTYINDSSDSTSMYEQLGLLKYLYPKEDPRSLVLMAAYNVINKLTVDIAELYKKAKKSKKNSLCFKGENAEVTVSFIDTNTSWIDDGCKILLRSL